VAVVVSYLSYLCRDTGIENNEAVARKIEKNALKYPVEKVKGRSDKYNEYS